MASFFLFGCSSPRMQNTECRIQNAVSSMQYPEAGGSGRINMMSEKLVMVLIRQCKFTVSALD